jgi:hypothetical protein
MKYTEEWQFIIAVTAVGLYEQNEGSQPHGKLKRRQTNIDNK